MSENEELTEAERGYPIIPEEDLRAIEEVARSLVGPAWETEVRFTWRERLRVLMGWSIKLRLPADAWIGISLERL